MSGMFGTFNTSASGMTAERFRLDIISNNLANANTTRTEEGGPYRRQSPIYMPRNAKFQIPFPRRKIGAQQGEGVRVVGVAHDTRDPRMVYDPYHPDANGEGYVAYPNVNVVREMVDMISATRAYEANVSAMGAAKQMANKALTIGRG